MELRKDGFAQTLGFEIQKQTDDEVILTLDLKSQHLNIHGYVHGGVYFSLSDIASGLMCLNVGGNWVTLDSNINYLKSTQSGRIEFHAKRLSLTRKLSVIEVSSYQDETRLTHGTFTMYRIGE